MAYTAVRFEIESAFAEPLSDALLSMGALSVDLSDKNAQTPDETPIYNEPEPTGHQDAPPPIRYWDHALVLALFPADVEELTVTDQLRDIVQDYGLTMPIVETFLLPERDWVRETQSQFSVIPISDTFFIVPTWCEPPDDAAYVLRLDPGLAFGTGSHPTTRLCLRWLCDHPPQGLSVLDYGCGSGILLLAARLLGADKDAACGVDIDPQAIIASDENARQNHLVARFLLPDRLPEGDRFDLTLANILANPLCLLAPLLAKKTKPGGTILLSGILTSQKEEVMARYKEWFNMLAWQEEDGWVLLEGKRIF
ncbi:MAG: 50S ribosomal protein L11 methyltransferase [Burkholderiales bacterium]|jgi:ribosomal protein L11 methyltransferase|nr:50S ribosomal protein L11 methyltransferase [Burkholderiales bacterium]